MILGPPLLIRYTFDGRTGGWGPAYADITPPLVEIEAGHSLRRVSVKEGSKDVFRRVGGGIVGPKRRGGKEVDFCQLLSF